MAVPARYIDPFNPVLLNSPAAVLSAEQQFLVNEVLQTAASDTKFADKAYDAISKILKGTNTTPPNIGSINPSTKAASPNPFLLTVTGTGFDASSVIYVGGLEMPTTFVSATSVTTNVTATLVGLLPVRVVKSTNNVVSNQVNLTIT